jgi:2-(1,2-epoxy-1,2-dihydrophenyl)acetyl-CoA isomerase
MLAGKTIIITGAAQGMGRATAERCVAEGATVLLTDRDARVEDVARELGAQALVGDVTDEGREMTYTTLEVARADGAGWITLNRPDRLNALTGEMFLELERAAAELAADPEVGAIVLTGRGRAFCAGADLKSYTTEVDVEDPHSVRDRMRLIARLVRAWTGLDKPTVAAVNGVAVGGGANLALMCDLVLMREDATLAQNYAQKGLVPDMGATYFLPRLVGRARAAELALLGDFVTAAEAERIGLVNRCIPADRFDAEVREYARRLSATPPRALELILTGLRHSPAMDLDTTLEWEANAIAMILSTPEARAAFRPKAAAR